MTTDASAPVTVPIAAQPADADGGRANNFDALRLFAAVSVIFSHAFLIAEGTEANEPIVRLTGNQTILGLCGVFVFFTISGYLVTESYCRNPSPWRFTVKRTLRIYPGLLLNIAICALLLGPLVTSLPLGAYLRGPELVDFLYKLATLNPGPTHLPGVVFADTSVGNLINGSMWTLRYEVMMYVMVLLLGVTRLLRLSTSLFLVTLGIAAVYFEKSLTPLGDLGEWAWLLGFFAAGMVLHFLRDKPIFTWRFALLAMVVLVAVTSMGRLIMLFPLCGSYLAIYFARRHNPQLDYARYVGDLSYGLYIYGWPAEQFVQWASGGHASWWLVFMGSLLVAGLLAWISWHTVEKRALALGRTRRGNAVPTPILATGAE